MSEDFDKEAERKRLREKYEADREDREATERMSELLLQGATMTNKHCDACGSPIFRYQGQEFCPSCQEERGGAAAGAGGEAATQEGADAQSATAAETADQPAVDTEASEPQAGPETGQPTTGTAEGNRATPGQDATHGAPQATTAGAGDRTTAGEQAGAGSVEEARAALVRTLTNLARRAEQTDDPRQAKELLAAAREAAETLARLRGN